LGSSNWGLQTTLERSYPLEASGETIGLSDYFTALVHEAWLKLKNSPPFAAKPLTKFKAIAANAVRQVLGGGGSDKADRAVHGRSFRGRRRRGGAFGGFEGSHCD
jgi:hypothetical protein